MLIIVLLTVRVNSTVFFNSVLLFSTYSFRHSAFEDAAV